MISELALPEYYVASVDIDASPSIGETVIGVAQVTLELDNPSLDPEVGGFRCEATLSMNLFYDGEAPWQREEDPGEEFGSIESTFVIYVSGERETLEPYVEEWISTNEYGTADGEFRIHIESGILQYIVDPMGELLEASFNGISPRISFSAPIPAEESDESSE